MEHQTRSCIACRKRGDKGTLARFAAVEGVIRWDRQHVLPGRGAYLHLRETCFGKGAEPAMWERALKVKVRAISIGEALREVRLERDIE